VEADEVAEIRGGRTTYDWTIDAHFCDSGRLKTTSRVTESQRPFLQAFVFASVPDFV
jgi:hypothetical protein